MHTDGMYIGQKKKEVFSMKKENDVFVENEQNDVMVLEYKNNPLLKIEIGTPQEVSQAYSFAKKIVATNSTYVSGVEEVVINIIATVSLHYLYAHYSDPEHYPVCPDLYLLSNFLKVNIVEEVYEDEDSAVIYDINNRDKVNYCVEFKSFIDILNAILNFQHVPKEGIDIKYWDKSLNNGTGGFAIRHFDSDMMHEIYQDSFDIYKVNPNVHPWIYRNLSHFLSNKNSFICEEALLLAPLAIDRYINEHPEYSRYNVYRKAYEQQYSYVPAFNNLKNLDNNNQNVENVFGETAESSEPVRKGRHLKSLKEIIKQVFSK